MAIATLPRQHDAREDRPGSSDVQRLVVTWQHPVSREISPIGLLTFDGTTYEFAYLKTVRKVTDFTPLLGFPDFDARYTSDVLFELFAQRAMDPRRPDYERYVTELGLTPEATPWEQIARSTGVRGSDTLQLFPAPRFVDGAWECEFLVHGIRYLLEKTVVFLGEDRSPSTSQDLEAAIESLSAGDELVVEHEATNQFSDTAFLIGLPDGRPLGWLPNWLSKELFVLHNDGALRFRVALVNAADAGWHLRIVAAFTAQRDGDYEFFVGDPWATGA